MNELEKNYKERFELEQIPNEDFDVEETWDAIENELEEKPKRRFLFFIWFIAGILLITAGGFTAKFLLNENNPSMANENASITDSDLKQISKKNSTFQDNETTSINVSIDDNSVLSKTIPLKAQSQEIEETEQNSGLDHLEKITLNNPIIRPENKVIETRKSEHIQIGKQIEKQISTIENQDTKRTDLSVLENKKAQSESPQFVSTVQYLPTSEIENLLIKSKLNVLDSQKNQISQQLIVTPDSSKSQKNTKWSSSITFFAGANINDLNFSSSSLTEQAILKSTAENPELGDSYGLQISFTKNDKWIFSSGFEQHNVWTRFDFKEEKNIQVLRENVLLSVDVDVNTRDTLFKFYGDTLVNGLAVREVTHFNTYKIFSIPLQFGIQHKINNLTLGINGGLVFNIIQSQQGKTLNEIAEIVEFNSSSLYAPFSFNTSLRVSPFVNYPLTEKWNLFLNPQMNWQLDKQSSGGPDFRSNSKQLNLNLGMNYSF